MTRMRRRQVEELVRAHYRAERGAPDAASKARALAAVRAAAAGRAADAGAGAGSCAGEGASACANGLPRPVAGAPAHAATMTATSASWAAHTRGRMKRAWAATNAANDASREGAPSTARA